MKNYKIIVTDLDGTLLNDSSEISRENLSAIKTLLDSGVHFVPSSGRTYSEIPQKLKNFDNMRFVIHSNGAVVYDRVTGKRIRTCLDNSTVVKIMDILKKYECHITFRCEGECYVDASMQADEDFEYYNVFIPHRLVVCDYANHLKDFYEYAYRCDNVEVFSVFFHRLEDKIECKRYFEEKLGLRAVEVSDHNIEVVNRKAGKGNALCALADMLGVDYSETIAVGDSDNDISMIKSAGLGLAVGNACDELKEAADAVICTNEEHAISYILNNYFNLNV